jgi:hypothetical protein
MNTIVEDAVRIREHVKGTAMMRHQGEINEMDIQSVSKRALEL